LGSNTWNNRVDLNKDMVVAMRKLLFVLCGVLLVQGSVSADMFSVDFVQPTVTDEYSSVGFNGDDVAYAAATLTGCGGLAFFDLSTSLGCFAATTIAYGAYRTQKYRPYGVTLSIRDAIEVRGKVNTVAPFLSI
jgi:hypothetical protein